MTSGNMTQRTTSPRAHIEKPSHLKYEAAVFRHLVDFKSCGTSLRISVHNFARYEDDFSGLNVCWSCEAFPSTSSGSMSADFVILWYDMLTMPSKQIVKALTVRPGKVKDCPGGCCNDHIQGKNAWHFVGLKS